MLTGQLYQLTSPVVGSDAFELPVDQATSKWPSACRHDFPFSVYFKGKWSVKVILRRNWYNIRPQKFTSGTFEVACVCRHQLVPSVHCIL